MRPSSTTIARACISIRTSLSWPARSCEKGLTLEPKHPLLRTSLAYQQMRQGDLPQAIETSKASSATTTACGLPIPRWRCAMLQGSRPRRVADRGRVAGRRCRPTARWLTGWPPTLRSTGDESEALHWLRRAIYLGNENYPWFAKNPAWNRLGHADFERILDDLKKTFRRNQKNWKRLLEQLPQASS